MIDGQNTSRIDELDGIPFTGISSDARQGSTGNAGDINITTTGALQLLNAGSIRSDTESQGDAGTLQIQASDILIDGANRPVVDIFTGISSIAVSNSTGNAGEIHVNTSGTLQVLNTGAITGTTESQGNGGRVVVHANTVVIDGGDNPPGLTGISTSAEGAGHAGTIEIVTEDTLHISNDGQIGSATFSEGTAGRIDITADRIMIDDNPETTDKFTGIGSHSREDASGQVGSIFIDTDFLLSDGGSITIDSAASALVAPAEAGQLTINAETIRLNNGSHIDASSNNAIPASNINITATESLYLDHSRITTSATEANGGNITLNPEVLILSGGFIQANTQGTGTTGGTVKINSEALISSQNNLQTGGQLVEFDPESDLNVIQSAAPNGVSGALDLNAPQLDISSSLAQLDLDLIDINTLIESPCDNPGIRNSKLSRLGRGGLPENTAEVRSVPLNQERLARLSSEVQSSTKPIVIKNPAQLHSSLKLALLSDCQPQKNEIRSNLGN